MDTAERIKQARLRLGYSQEGFSRELGVSTQTVSRWERGKNVPRRYADRLADLTGIPTEELAPEPEDEAALAGDLELLAGLLMESFQAALGEIRKGKGRRPNLARAATAPDNGSVA
jgi:transcriptional regulator with XRE-family HTH domain